MAPSASGSAAPQEAGVRRPEVTTGCAASA